LDAKDEVLADLGRLKRRRWIGLISAGVGFSVILGAMIAAPAGHGPVRDEAWQWSVGVLFISGLFGAASVLGPAGGRSLSLAGSVALIAAVALGVRDPGEPLEGLRLHCLMIGSGIGLLSLLAFTAVSDPLWGAAVLSTGVGLSFLCTHCDRSDAAHLFLAHLPALVIVYGVARLLGRAAADA
jgi:hypothetical protein